MYTWWQLIVFALHVISAQPGQFQPFDLQVFAESHMVLSGRVGAVQPGLFSFQPNEDHWAQGPVFVERSRRHTQVYTLFSSWSGSEAFGDIPGLADSEGTSGGNSTTPEQYSFASGPYPPLLFDLTPWLTQFSLTNQGTQTIQWVDQLQGQDAQVSLSADRISIAWTSQGMTLSSPERGLVLLISRANPRGN